MAVRCGVGMNEDLSVTEVMSFLREDLANSTRIVDASGGDVYVSKKEPGKTCCHSRCMVLCRSAPVAVERMMTIICSMRYVKMCVLEYLCDVIDILKSVCEKCYCER
jgi:hypothetical protein